MGKNPAFQFYPDDWLRDLQDHPLEIEGAWIRIICKLWWSETKGVATKPLTVWSKILGTHHNKALVILKYIESNHIGNVVILDNQNITITSRRMIRDEHIRQIRREVGKLGGNPTLLVTSSKLDNQTGNQKPTPSSSSSSPISSKKKKISPPSGGNGKFELFWKAYPKHIEKKDALSAWNMLNPNDDRFKEILNALEIQKKSPSWLKDNGDFIPYPAKWIKKRKWEDETIIPLKTGAVFSSKQADARSCYMRCHGNCAALWAKYKTSVNEQCHWCTKFDAQRGEQNAL